MADSYSYPATSNRLGGIALGAGGSRAFTYDAAGNVTNEARAAGAYSYTYDSAGRMASFSIGGVLQASYKYDFAGRQVVRALTSPTAVTIHSVFDSDGNRIAEYNEATGVLIREYVWLNGEPLAVIEGGAINYVRVDHIGRPVFATNTAGATTWTASYLPFGEVRTATGTPIALRFPGQWFQSESGLHQNWMRDYDPTTGRYVEPDPIGLEAGVSLYGYALQNPGRYIDPTGENPLALCATPVGGVLCREAAREVAKVCIAGAQIVAGAVVGLFASTDEACGCEDDCPFEVTLSSLRRPGAGKLKEIIAIVGHPHEYKDDSTEDVYIDPKSGCVYVGNKDGRGMGRLVGKV